MDAVAAAIYHAIGRMVFALGLLLVGAAAWSTLERFNLVPAHCVMDSGAYEVIKADGEMRR